MTTVHTERNPAIPRPFGFSVARGLDWETMEPKEDNWHVTLPHQCDSWEISEYGSTHAQAVADLRRFIAEAQAALAHLERHEECEFDE